ncbi:MAG: MBL fold metallo-hydrolase [Cyanobacteria bacterium J06623_7]
MNRQLYLKPNVIAEPLFNQWYAWSYLIPPATAARYVAKSHIAIMESFIAAPEVHVSALKNPALIGGPFVNYGVDRVWEIEALLEKTKLRHKALLDLDSAISKLDLLLQNLEAGSSLETLYEKVPEILKGYVELVYDRHHNPGIRFIEGLLYRSRLYNPASQSVLLHLTNPDTRPFVLSTPRLSSRDSLQVNLPFSDRRWDKLFQMRSTPHDVEHISHELGIGETDIFQSFFTSIIPNKKLADQGKDVRIRYFGHACILIEADGVSILVDPLISYPNPAGIPRYSYEDLPDHLDYVLITHNHQDHVMFETLLQIRYKIGQVVIPKSNRGSLIDPSLKLILQQLGFNNLLELDELETIALDQGQIVSLPVLGEHGDLNISAKNAYLIQLQGKSILCAADSNNIEPDLYRHLYSYFGDLDIMFIGMECDGAPFTWAYGALLGSSIPRQVAETRRLDGSDSQKATALVKQFNPQQVYVYAMGQEPWLTYITSIQYTPDSKPIIESAKLVEFCRQHGVRSEVLFGRKEIVLEQREQRSRGAEVPWVQEKNVENVERRIETEKFVKYLRSLDIKISLDNTELIIDAPKGSLNQNLIAELKKRKPEIIEFLLSQLKLN